VTTSREAAKQTIADHAGTLLRLSHTIHAHPELCFEEERAAAWTANALSDLGFEVSGGTGGLATAFTATAGAGPLTLAICAEYDALPSIGHACGHNIIAASAVGAAAALVEVADDLGITVQVIGTPAEEGGGGKVLLLEAGAFDAAHAAMMVHPGTRDDPEPLLSALATWQVHYHGREAHAAAAPWLGVNAADAMVIANVAIGMLRQQFEPADRVHGIVVDGGAAANVIPASTSAHFFVRSHNHRRLLELEHRIRRCFEAGAMATGCTFDIEEGRRYADMVTDPRISRLWERNAEQMGRGARRSEGPMPARGSTDMGNVSHALPSIHPIIDIGERVASSHQPGFTAACITAGADAAVLDGSLLLALTAIDIAGDSDLSAALIARDTGSSNAVI
jgi:amidohydrolase